jgi:hypothetical protein
MVAPTAVVAASRNRRRPEWSAMAPTMGMHSTWNRAEIDTRYGYQAAARIGMPSGCTNPFASAAASAAAVRNGPANTVMTVVGKAELAQSYQYQARCSRLVP